MTNKLEKLSIYIHIPFCIRKCLYCDFLSAPKGERERKNYVEALCREIALESSSYVNYEVATIFIGGGTPSILPGEQIEQILRSVYEHYKVEKNCEISMEANPGTITLEKLKFWRGAGVNRLSIGLQSAIDHELRALGRIHNSEMFFQSYEMVVKSGFNNINVDLMSAIPGQSVESYQETLYKVTGLNPPPAHISAYSLIIEEGTSFYENTPELPDEDSEREMYKITNDILSEQGYVQYEISNYAKPGFACRHNQVYWRRGNYVGFGIGAASLVENVRFSNIRDFESYVNYYMTGNNGVYSKEHTEDIYKYDISDENEVIKENIKQLSLQEQMEEYMFLGLRMINGISEEDFLRNFGSTIDQIYPGIVEDFCQKGLLKREIEAGTGEHRVFLTRYGIDVSNIVMAEFLLT